jgi:hypothetical protein
MSLIDRVSRTSVKVDANQVANNKVLGANVGSHQELELLDVCKRDFNLHAIQQAPML